MSDTAAATTSLAPLYAALSRAIGRASAVGKDAENSFHRYKYASAEGLIAEAREALAIEELAVFSSSWQVVDREREAASALGYFADVNVVYTVAHASGASMICTASTPVISEKGRPEDKAVATALTYNLGYFLRGLLLLPRVDAEHDADQRDDRDYQPQQSRSGQRQAEGGNRGNGHATPTSGPRLPDPPKPAAEGKPFDMTAIMASIATVPNLTAFDALVESIAPKIADCHEAQKQAVRATLRKRREELIARPTVSDAGASPEAKPTDTTPIDKGWVDFLADISTLVKADASTWSEDDVGAEFAVVTDRAATRNELNVQALPWISAANKRAGRGRAKGMLATLKRMMDGRMAEISQQPQASP